LGEVTDVGIRQEEDRVCLSRRPGNLIRLYEREGFIAEALEIARRGVALGQEPDEVQRLEACLRDLEAEDVA
jgi:hypothetical protein